MFIRTITFFRLPVAGTILGLAIFLAGSAQAFDVYVNNGSVSGPAGVDSTANGLSSSTPFNTIKYALGHFTNSAGTVGGASDIIHIVAGTYTESNLVVKTNCTILGDSGPAATIVQAATSPAGQPSAKAAVFVLDTNGVVTISGLTIQYGNNGGSGNQAYGGGIACNSTHIMPNFNATITNCVINYNGVNVDHNGGGGIAIGALGNTGFYPGTGVVTIVDCTIVSNFLNTVHTRGAPGIYLCCSNFTVRNCTIAYNTANAAIFESSSYVGGGIVAYGCLTGSIIQCTIVSNGASSIGATTGPCQQYGGGIRWDLTSMPKIPGGGGVIRNCTIVGNMATNGGGVAITGTSGTGTNLLIESCLIANNISPTGQGADVWWTGSTTITNVLEQYNLIGNGATNSGVAANSWLPLSSATVAGGWANTSTNIHGSYVGSNNNYAVALNLGPLQNNGGKTMTMALLSSGNAPAVDHGANNMPLTYDQRGTPYERTFGNGTDIGAYEYKAGPTNLTYNAYGWNDQPYGSGIISYLTTNGTTPMILTLDNATFAGTDMTTWSLGDVSARMVTTNLPNGLTVNVKPTNSLSAAVIWLSGTVSDPHGAVNSFSNLVFGFKDAAFDNPSHTATAAQINGAVATNLNITYHDAVAAGTLTYGSTNFYENIQYNDGRIATTNKITLTGDVWTNSIVSGSLLSFVTITGVPDGLSAQVDATGAGSASFYFTGQATTHAAGSSNVVLIFSPGAFQKGVAAVNSVMTNVITFYDPASLVTLNYSGTTFNENSTANDGSMVGSITITLVSNLFVAGAASYVSSPDLPANLALQATYANNSNLTIALTGNAANNNAADNAPFHVQFQPGAFYNLAPGVSVVNSNQVLNLSFSNPSLTWSGSFKELLPDNNGSIDPATFVTGTLVGDTFAVASPAFTPNNLPGGLTMNVATTSATTVKVTLTGNANAHAAANSTNNLGLTFQNSAFTQSSTHGGAAAVSGYNPANWSITYYNPNKTWYVADPGATPAGSETNNGSSGFPFATITNAFAHAGNYDVIHIVGTVTESEVNGIPVSKNCIIEGDDTLSQHGQSIVQGASSLGGTTNRLFNSGGAAAYVQFRNLTLRNGNDTTSGGNSSANGGGAIGCGVATLIVSNCLIYGCQTMNGYGGAIDQVSSGGKAYIFYSTICSNSSFQYGGGVYLQGGTSQAYVYNSTIFGNSSSGSGPGLYDNNLATALVQNCTICLNTTTNTGSTGALSIGNGAPATIQNCTIAYNSASGGVAGLGFQPAASNQIFVQSTIIAMNTTNGLPSDIRDYTTFLPVESCNLIGNNTNSGSTAGTVCIASAGSGTPNANGSYVGTNTDAADPQLAPLANNGGPTPTMALQPRSLAINHGSNPGGIPYDQRGAGYPRVVNGVADIGAYEYKTAAGLTIFFF